MVREEEAEDDDDGEEEEELFWTASLSRCHRHPRAHFLVDYVTGQHGGWWTHLSIKNKE